MSKERVKLARGLTSLRAFGVEGPAELLEGDLGPRAEVLGTEPERVRFPLPGTPAADGGLTGSPRGAGTGWVVLRRWRAPRWAALVSARFTQPRSASLAEREWNLLCHLRSNGVGAPEPLAVGARGEGLFARSSFLVTRDLEGYVPLAEWFADQPAGETRRRAVAALASFLGKLTRAGVVFPHLSASSILVRGGDHDHGHDHGGEGESCSNESPAEGMRLNRWPTIVLAGAEDGRLAAEPSLDALTASFAPLARELRDVLLPGEARRVFARVTRGLERSVRSRLAARLSS